MVQINIIGDIFNSSGYAMHTRELANALCKFTDVRLTTGLCPNWERLVNDDELKMIKRNPVKDEINLIITMPHMWKLFTNNNRNWAYCVWEGDKVPESFIKEFENPDIEKIIVPSEHTKKAIFNTLFERYPDLIKDKEELGSTTELLGGQKLWQYQDVIDWDKIKVINHGVDLEKFYPKEKTTIPFTFLCNKGFRNIDDRGGIQYAIKAYLEEFNDKDEVSLILKINPAYGVPDMNKIIQELKIENKSLPKINVIATDIPYNQLVDIYNSCDVFISSTRCEGFNIPCLEAMACGKPVITTNFGGQTDFCNKETGWIVGGELEEVKFDLMYEGIKWLTPSIKELRKAMREAYKSNMSAFVTDTTDVAKNLQWKHTAMKFISLI